MRLQHTECYCLMQMTSALSVKQWNCAKDSSPPPKKFQLLNKSNNISFLDWTVFTFRTGTKFTYGKNSPHAHSPSASCRGVRYGAGPQETLCLEAVSLQPQVSCKCLPEGSERWPSPVHAWVGDWAGLGQSSSNALATTPTTTIK